MNTYNEVIDLTIDSPVPNFLAPRSSCSYGRLPRRTRTSNRDILVEQNDSFIQIIDPDEPLPIINQIDNEEVSGDTGDSANSTREYNTAIPCVRQSIGAEVTPLSCPICFESLTAKQKPTTTRCGHIFCAKCLERSLQISRNKTCPICNAPVRIKSCIRLHFL